MSYATGETLLKVEDVSLKFGEKLVLRDINLEIKNIIGNGQVTTVLGRSGVGKTQLMKIIAGLLKPTEGQVLIGTEQKPVEPGIVGMVLQTYPLFKHKTLLQNLQLVSNDKDKIETFLNEFDILDHKSKYPTQLSGGQRQRAAIVQQLLCSEHFIELDEPFSGLDPVATEKLCKTISKVAHAHENNTVIISSHILEPSLAISDSIWILGHDYVNLSDIDASLPSERGKVQGARVMYQEDLAAQGLAWDPEIRKNPAFMRLVEGIREVFNNI